LKKFEHFRKIVQESIDEEPKEMDKMKSLMGKLDSFLSK